MFFSFFQFFNGWISMFKELIRLYTGEVVCSTSFIQLLFVFIFNLEIWK